ncbi:5-(carboxyamino)imidazole ribonucleotide synthase [Nonlabens xylanidelens]|uniref:N5-carboxyaminoimidazole ribonucleotide synthase n=1 Tax=Nonlabens xylanidelens TaxID=191564 RepID=A0A2S6IS87_9FLAO|nr:5-(carboxyamino)imidazole ribonucleotide synthase [Nonlabens xylanidelens]PPK97132.1 5-(carboxyamino)imidazole ribonucleotide synthase [Nonlabens xylanidelens]PQJ13814.1 5-(carboxyamino)imidazole ribonucleotide synthase [Nonlabens xylanidelens]
MKQTQFSSGFTLGILGGGQLGKMMLYTTRKWDINTYVMDKDDTAPAFQGCDVYFEGDIMDYESVMEFGEQVDVLTVEIENVNVQALQDLEDKGIAVSPSAKVLNLIRNKARQKSFYLDKSIATAAFEVYSQPNLEHQRNYPFIWKSAEGGYDGKGVKVIRQASDLEDLPQVECIYEDMVDFDLELAVIVARNANGEMKTYPVVEMEFHPEANQVEYVICPARINMDISDRARELALEVSEAYEHVGLLAVEMFLTKSGELLVNEVAPRPHNSGHHTIEGSITDQFEQHVRSVCNLPLGATDSTVASVMVNLVGEEGHTGNVIYDGIEDILAMPGVTPHIYGKKETRPFRKMGHVTIVADDIVAARELAEVVKGKIRVIAE